MMGETQQANLASGDNTELCSQRIGKVGFMTSLLTPVKDHGFNVSVSVLREFVRSRMASVSNGQAEKCTDEPKAKKQNLVLFEKEDGSIRILDALSASGLRALRFSQEVEKVDFVVANDFSENAVESIKENIRLNGVEDKVRATFGDAVSDVMRSSSALTNGFTLLIRPMVPFCILGIRGYSALRRGGYSFSCFCTLCATEALASILCGNTPETCYNKYGSTTVRLKCCHEMALRILLRAIDSQANKYTRYIEPLLSISVDFYVRVFVRLHTGARMAKESGTKVGNLLACSGCHSLEVVPILKKVEDGKSLKYTTGVVRQTLMGGDNKCVHCGHPVHQAGPIWTGAIHNREFVEGILKRLKETPEEERLGTHSRLLGVLTNVSEVS
ncbi:N2,N2-dimethylguanosine tRNA methyltransferase, partial [Cooperia oncophora]